MTILNELVMGMSSAIVALIAYLLINIFYFKKYEELIKKIEKRKINAIDKKYKNKKNSTKIFLDYHKEWHKFEEEIEELEQNVKSPRFSAKVVIGVLIADGILALLNDLGTITYSKNFESIISFIFVISLIIFVVYLWNIYLVMKDELKLKSKFAPSLNSFLNLFKRKN